MIRLIILLIAMLILSCEKENSERVEFKEVSYSGEFWRECENCSEEIAEITLVFSEGNYSGSSNKMYYPAIGHGNYEIKGNTILFNENSFWSANFDWSFILGGSFHIEETAEYYYLSQKLNSDATNYYKLKKNE